MNLIIDKFGTILTEKDFVWQELKKRPYNEMVAEHHLYSTFVETSRWCKINGWDTQEFYNKLRQNNQQ